MPNLSQLRRQKMLEFLSKIKEEHKDDDDTLIALGEIENELTSKKYGLVWEKHEEAVDVKMRTHIPVFTEVKEREIDAAPGESYNFLLEGDNLHSLYLLEKTHKGRIDVIYIDPPYNSGENDFMYDDNYVDASDTFKHSKWLSFMYARLTIARELLSHTGFIFISIDDKEASQLKLLCDDVFGDQNYEKTDYIQVRYPEKTLKSDMKYHKEIEQVLIYKKSEASQPYIEPEEYNYDKFIYSIQELADGKEIILGNKRVVIFEKDEYKIVKHSEGYKEGLKEVWATGTILNGNSSGRFFRDYIAGRKDVDGLGVLYKVYDIGDDKYNYRYFTGPKQKGATKGKYYQGVPVDKLEEGSEKFAPLPNYFDMAADFGNIRHEGGVTFNGGKKPTKLIKQYLKFFNRKNIKVLDFFAGSGSTAQAVLDLNSEDNGHRTFILCTNNENNICTEKTYPRLCNVINGYGKYAAELANLKYYRTDFVSRDEEFLADELLKHITEMIQLEHGVNIDDKQYVMVLSDEEADELQRHWNEYQDIKAIYISRKVLLTTEQNMLFGNTEIHIIPDDYFEFELKEEGQAW